MQWSQINFNPAARTLRRFAGLSILFFGSLAGWQGFLHGWTTAAILLAVVAVLVGALGLIRPQAIRWIYVSWMIATYPIGWVTSQVILAAMFFGVITPVALYFRLLGRDALHRRRQPQNATYWAPKPTANDAASYLRQF